MKYSTVGDSGADYTVEIYRHWPYATLRVQKNGVLLYNNKYLPSLKTQIKCEDNAIRIANDYIK